MSRRTFEQPPRGVQERRRSTDNRTENLTRAELAPGRAGRYVFLFFYGLERRAIIDAAHDESARADWPAIAAELRRLLSIYGEKSGSFRGYAGALLDWVALAEHPPRLYEKPVPSFPRTFELPLYVRLALGQAAVDGAPVPAHLALAWARLEPNINLRTPATRCAAEFEQLFGAKYAEAFGAGMVMPRNRTKLKLVYRPPTSTVS
ncbi:MAG: TerB N-terminal domain-containing protein [Rubrivivax sp.]